jgi:PAS domain S-box-containing protein
MATRKPASGKQLVRLAGFFRRLCDEAGVGIIAVDRELRICVWNQAAEQLLAAPADRRLGEPAETAVREADRKQFTSFLSQALMRGTVGEMEMRYPREAAEGELNLIMTISPIRDEVGQPIGAAAWVRDISKRVRLERYRARSSRMVSLGVMASGVAHHFNNILASVVTAVDDALATGDRASMRRALERTAAAVNRATDITDHLLAFAEGHHRTHAHADLTEVVLTFTQRIERDLAEGDIEFEFQHLSVPMRSVPANQFSAVLNHLYNNALDAMAGRGRLAFRLAPAGSEILLSIADSGPGIAREHLDRVFEPFFTTKGGEDPFKTSGHVGLGLAVVHGLVKEMGGRVEVDSALGRGTEFRIYIPLGQLPQPGDSAKSAARQANPPEAV